MKSAKADEIFGFASDEIKSTHPPSRRISPNEVGFHRRRRFHPPARVDLVENDRFLSESVVFWRSERDLNSGKSLISLTKVSCLLPKLFDSRTFHYRILMPKTTINHPFLPQYGKK